MEAAIEPVVLSSRRRQILDVAARLFSERGYRDTTMRDISDEMGLKAGSLYSHIKSKEELLYQLMLVISERLVTSAEEASAFPGSAATRLQRFIQGQIELLREYPAGVRILLGEWRFLSDGPRAEIFARRRAGEEYLRRILLDGIAAGEFVVDSEKWARLAILSVTNWASQWYRYDGDLSPVELAEKFCQVFINGMSPRSGISAPLLESDIAT